MSPTSSGTMSDHLASARPRDHRLRLALRLAQMIRTGTLTVVLPDGSAHRVVKSAEPSATIVIKDPRAVTRLVTGGSLGLAEAYLDALWESPDIRGVMAVAAVNEAEWLEMLKGRPWIRAASKLFHLLRPNTRKGARRNIAEHYDLGNDFYARWLDPSMTYSSALFAGSQETLEGAQMRKMRRLCDVLGLRPGMTVLEIGCGWGAFAELAAREYGVSVLGITLSAEQLAFAQARVRGTGLEGRVEFRLQDYRDVPGQFDRIVSVEMFEAVGETYWPAYFATLRERLNPGGLAGLQTITIEDRLFPDYLKTADFIQRHIFPGGMLPSPSRLRDETARAGLNWLEAHWFGNDYAETLARWQAAFQTAWSDITTLSPAYDARFKRLWEYYLSYCETGFRAGWTDVGQILLAKPA
jgi:cyclopropane-fatty-acyl-phospholipid synthase